jgi:DNA-binding XRE family transcriptional regulator
MTLTSPCQIRAARALIGWTQNELAVVASVSEMSIKNIERDSANPRVSTLASIKRALEAAGIEFTNGGEPGVRLRKFRTGDVVRFKSGMPETAEFGDDLGVILRERTDIPLGGGQWVDIDFQGKRQLIGMEVGRLEFGGLRRTKKTSKELADMIAAGINIGGVYIEVHHDPLYGWHPTVVTFPAQAVNCQNTAEEIAKNLRIYFVLASTRDDGNPAGHREATVKDFE